MWRVFSYWFIWEYQYKSIAELSYSLLRGRDFSLQMSLPGDIPSQVVTCFRILLNKLPMRREVRNTNGFKLSSLSPKTPCRFDSAGPRIPTVVEGDDEIVSDYHYALPNSVLAGSDRRFLISIAEQDNWNYSSWCNYSLNLRSMNAATMKEWNVRLLFCLCLLRGSLCMPSWAFCRTTLLASSKLLAYK